MQTAVATTPLMKQYFEIKKQFHDTLLLFQVGEFYELFFDDALEVSRFLGIALTKRGTHNGEPIPLCGVPLHTSEFHIAKLVRGGYKVALCNQLEEAQPGKVVRRGVEKVYTPGTIIDATLLDEKSPTYLAALVEDADKVYMVVGELLTGQLQATFFAYTHNELESELARFTPSEIILPTTLPTSKLSILIKKLGYYVGYSSVSLSDIQRSAYDVWYQRISQGAEAALFSQPLQLYFSYLFDHHQNALHDTMPLSIYKAEDFLVLDTMTIANLELIKNNVDGSTRNTLFEVLDRAVTPMGSRLIKKWLLRPLMSEEKIIMRQAVVKQLMHAQHLLEKVRLVLKTIGDFERAVGRIALSKAQLSDYLQLKQALEVIPKIRDYSQNESLFSLIPLCRRIGDFSQLCDYLDRALPSDPLSGTCIKQGFDEELDKARTVVASAAHSLVAFEQREREQTGINSLKVGYTSVFGYYLEITKSNLSLIPEHYKRLQTLSGRERYTTSELQDLERALHKAEKEISILEDVLYQNVKAQVYTYVPMLQKASQALAALDALTSLALIAQEGGYVCPTFNKRRNLSIEDGRHPVIEKCLGSHFIPNNCLLADAQSMLIITGPNMGGKSTYLRQTALMVIMAQIGSFVPAKCADLFLVDRIFTRIGASDKMSQGKSTFLVEMEETALICKNATSESLVILDEVGRGTSTFDGLAIARAVVEYLHQQVKVRGLFATHYHELVELEHEVPGIAVYHVASTRYQGNLVFLYKVIRGNADGSFGIDVAELAQLPGPVIKRAREILSELS